MPQVMIVVSNVFDGQSQDVLDLDSFWERLISPTPSSFLSTHPLSLKHTVKTIVVKTRT